MNPVDLSCLKIRQVYFDQTLRNIGFQPVLSSHLFDYLPIEAKTPQASLDFKTYHMLGKSPLSKGIITKTLKEDLLESAECVVIPIALLLEVSSVYIGRYSDVSHTYWSSYENSTFSSERTQAFIPSAELLQALNIMSTRKWIFDLNLVGLLPIGEVNHELAHRIMNKKVGRMFVDSLNPVVHGYEVAQLVDRKTSHGKIAYIFRYHPYCREVSIFLNLVKLNCENLFKLKY